MKSTFESFSACALLFAVVKEKIAAQSKAVTRIQQELNLAEELRDEGDDGGERVVSLKASRKTSVDAERRSASSQKGTVKKVCTFKARHVIPTRVS